MSTPSEFVFLYTTLPDHAAAEAIAKPLVEAKLAACVNILQGVRSIYIWNDALETASEVVALIKTRRSLVAAVEAEVAARHPYETPALLVLPIEAINAPYLAWARAQTVPQ